MRELCTSGSVGAPGGKLLGATRPLAKQMPTAALRSLSHHMDLPWLREAFRRTRKDGAVGVDGQTAAQYAEDLEGNLESLLNRAKSGQYRAPPVRWPRTTASSRSSRHHGEETRRAAWSEQSATSGRASSRRGRSETSST